MPQKESRVLLGKRTDISVQSQMSKAPESLGRRKGQPGRPGSGAKGLAPSLVVATAERE